MSTTAELADFAVATELRQLPPALVEEIKLLLLDLIGCALAGTAVSKGRIAVELARSAGRSTGRHHYRSRWQGFVDQRGLRQRRTHERSGLGSDTPRLAMRSSRQPGRSRIPPRQRKRPDREHRGQLWIAARLAPILPSELEVRPHGYGWSVISGTAGVGSFSGLRRKS